MVSNATVSTRELFMKRLVNLLYIIGFPLAFIGVWMKDPDIGWLALVFLLTGLIIELIMWARKNNIF